MTTYFESLTEEQKEYYSFKNHIIFDTLCETSMDVFDCIRMSICKEYTTADFECEKYIWFRKDVFVYYILQMFQDKIYDWKHLLVTAIFNHSHKDVYFMILFQYHAHFGTTMYIDPETDDVLFACFLSNNIEAMIQIFKCAVVDKTWIDLLMSKGSRENLRVMLQRWNLKDATNPRNLFYAIFHEDAETAIALLEDGSRADIWNNKLMRMVVSKRDLRSNNKLVKLMLDCGGKLPKFKKTVS